MPKKKKNILLAQFFCGRKGPSLKKDLYFASGLLIQTPIVKLPLIYSRYIATTEQSPYSGCTY